MKSCFPDKVYACLLLLLPFSGSSQKSDFSFFPIAGIEPRHQYFAGNTGSHFFLLEPSARPGLGLYIYDTVSREGISRHYDFYGIFKAVIEKPHSLAFVALRQTENSATVSLLEINENGDSINKKENVLETWRGPVSFASSANKNKMLFYQLKKTGADSVLIKGYLIDQDGNMIKNILYTFQLDPEMDAEPEFFLDIYGNTHILVYDRYLNYKLSTNLSVNTIPALGDEIVSETFGFEKVKLKNMRISQNTQCNCMQAEGLYTDGVQKSVRGIYSIVIPSDRKSRVASGFIPFGADMTSELKKGFFETEETIRNSVQLQTMLYSDSGSFAILRLSAGSVQSPAIRKAQERHDAQPGLHKTGHGSSLRGTDIFLPQSANRIQSVVSSIPAGDVYDQPLPYNRNDAAFLGDLSPLWTSSHAKKAPKFICVKLSAGNNGFDWTLSRALDIFSFSYNIYNQPNLLTGEKGEVSAIIYKADKFNQPYPVFITMRNGNQFVQDLPENKLWFSSFVSLGRQRHASLYFNYEKKEGGLMIVTGNRQASLIETVESVK